MQDNINIWCNEEVHMEFQVWLKPQPRIQEQDFL